VRLTVEALRDSKIQNRLNIAKDGLEAMAFLRRKGEYANAPHPDLILLDLNLPKMDGPEVLAEIKGDTALKHIPVVILTGSKDAGDITKTYNLHANCYVTKPIDLDQFIKVVKSVRDFWLTIVKLPTEEG
jgi:chemotaxis family two-component system response regulator Rcp1